MSKYIKSLLSQNPNFRNEVEDIIDVIKISQYSKEEKDIHNKINEMVEEILNSLDQEVDVIDLSKMSPQAKQVLIDEISSIIADLVKSEQFSNKQELIELITLGILGRFSSNSKKRNEELEYDLLDEEQKKKLEEEISKAIMYEAYKKTNPNQVAGETLEQNVENNLRRGGVELASKHDGAELLGKMKPGHVKKIIKETDDKGQGGSGVGF